MDEITAGVENRIPPDFAPQEGKAAVLSLMAISGDEGWTVVSGSLLTVPTEVAEGSWSQWADTQPQTRGSRTIGPSPDLGAEFTEEPFPGLRIARVLVKSEDWQSSVGELEAGELKTPDGTYRFDVESWSSTKLFTPNGLGLPPVSTTG